MAKLPPAPIRDPWGSYTWEEWFRIIANRTQQSLTSVTWSGIDFTGSSLTNILDRKHNDLQNMQGGTSAEYYHLTSAEYLFVQEKKHNSLLSLQGGTSSEYYHLTSAEYTLLQRNNTQEYVTPVTGFSNTIGNTTGVYIINPSGTLATGSIAMPAAPVDKQRVVITTTQTITALTHTPNAGQTLKGALTTLTADTSGTWVYRSADTTWYRI